MEFNRKRFNKKPQRRGKEQDSTVVVMQQNPQTAELMLMYYI